MPHKIKNAKTLQKKSRSHQVTHLMGHTYQVESGASGNRYHVTLRENGATCNCKWGQYRPTATGSRSGCSHVQSVYNHIEQTVGRSVSAWTDEGQAKRQHRPTWSIGDGVILTSRKTS